MLPLNAHKGQGLVEYALILLMVVIVVVLILAILGPEVGNLFSNVTSEVQNVTSYLPTIQHFL
jgi:pilus assembly protein Flp/PilA